MVVRTGLTLLVLGSAPLVAIIAAAKVGLFFAGVLATGCLAIGAVWVWLELRQSAA
jgi:hypothetical protein